MHDVNDDAMIGKRTNFLRGFNSQFCRERERENSSFYGKEKTTHKLYIIPFTQQKVYYYYIVYTCKASRLSLFFFFFFFSVGEERELELGVKLLFVCACFCVDNSDDDFESKGTAAFFFLGASLLNPTP